MAAFYQAGTFWVTVAGVLVSLGIGLLAAWIASRSVPKRRLFYGISDPVPLMTPDGIKHGLEVRRGGQKLTDPCLVDLTLHSSGRQSITSEMYDQGRPLALQVNVPIVALLKVANDPPEQAIPKNQVSGSTLKVGPDVLAAKQRITFSLLVDGRPNLELESHFSDVSIKQQAGPEQMVRRVSYVALGAAVLAVVSFMAYTQLTASVTSPPTGSSGHTLNLPARLPPFGKVEKTAYRMLSSFGLDPKTQYRCLGYLWEIESGWNYRTRNHYSGSYGIPQALPADKMASAGPNWRTNPATQIRWGLGYIKSVYGTPCNAWAFEESHGFY